MVKQQRRFHKSFQLLWVAISLFTAADAFTPSHSRPTSPSSSSLSYSENRDAMLPTISVEKAHPIKVKNARKKSGGRSPKRQRRRFGKAAGGRRKPAEKNNEMLNVVLSIVSGESYEKKSNNQNRKTRGESKQRSKATSRGKKYVAKSNVASSSAKTRQENKKQPNKRQADKKQLHVAARKPEKKSWKELTPGSTVSGKVVKMLPYGALVQTPFDIPRKHKNQSGLAMLHISQISNEKIDDISSKLKVGQYIRNARVVSVNRDDARVQLSLRKQTQRAIRIETLKVGDEVEGKIVHLENYGAFVDVGCKRNALLHQSRISLYKIVNLEDFVKVGDTVQVRVAHIDTDEQNIAVSMLSKENDKFVDRREIQKRRMSLWQNIMAGKIPKKDLEHAKKQLFELDKSIWDDYQASLTTPRTGEV